MCGISGFCNLKQNYQLQQPYWEEQLFHMGKALSHRGKPDSGSYLTDHVGFSHAYTCLCDTARGTASTDASSLSHRRQEYAILCDGELYNSDELLPPLRAAGYAFDTTSDANILLAAYIHYGPSFVSLLNGVFALAIWDNAADKLLLYRDHAGIKPLFYSMQKGTLVFGSEPKALFAHSDITPRIDKTSLQEILALGPAHTSGSGVFCDMCEVLPGHYVTFSSQGVSDSLYWDLTAQRHTDSYSDTVDQVSFLVRDALRRQLLPDTPVCSFLSGGIDSSIVTALAADHLRKNDKILTTFSFDFTENDIYFQSNAFQPERDLPYINIMLSHCKTNHTYLECAPTTLADLLPAAVDARDLPGMTDVDASLLYFCNLAASQMRHTTDTSQQPGLPATNLSMPVALTGECSDEIFGGYPWFYRKELLYRDGFPWSADMSARTIFLNDDLCRDLQLADYSYARYQNSLSKVPSLDGESEEETRRRAVSYLNIKWFMQTLLDRMDRTGMYSGLKARVPFADHRIMEYLFNVPWEMKYQNSVEKALLRDACADLLHRSYCSAKSPYPKTYHPGYEKLLVEQFGKIIDDSNAPIAPLIDKEKAKKFMVSHKELGKPWYGQLMAGPQLMAYFIQINYWMEKYQLTV